MPDHDSAGIRLRGDGLDLVSDHWSPPAGPPLGSVLLLHGGGQTRHSWHRTGRRLAERGWLAWALDARGHGDSEWSPEGDYSSRAHARDIRAVVDHLDQSPVLVGASMGGLAALTAVAADPSRYRGLVLVDITPKAEPEGIDRIKDFMASGLDGFDSLEAAADAVHAYNPHRPRPPRPDGLRKNLRLRSGRWYWHWDPALITDHDDSLRASRDRERDIREAARNVAVPTLLIRGGRSDIVSDAGVQDLLDLIPTARCVDVRDAGHMVSGDDNDEFSSGLEEFLTSAVLADTARPDPDVTRGIVT